MTKFPSSLDDSNSLPNPTAKTTMRQMSHSQLHTAENEAIIAAQTKLGTGSSTPSSDHILIGTADGVSEWLPQISESMVTNLQTDLNAKANTTDVPTTFDDLGDGTINKAFTSTEKTKLSGIESGAEVNTVDTVNSKTGNVLLNPDDLDDTSTTHKFVTAEDRTNLGNLSGVNTGDQTIDEILPAQLGNSGKFLSTDGTNSFWDIPSGGGGGGSTNISITLTSDSVRVDSDTGADGLIQSADGTNAGILTSADKLKLDSIEASADVTDSTNVDAAGAVMNTDTTTVAMGFVIDEDTMATNTATKVPTQQSVKAYVDTNSGVRWSNVTGTTQTAVKNKGYIINSSTLCTVTLPSTCAVGDVVRVLGSGAGGWKIAQTASRLIKFGNMTTTTGTSGYLASVETDDAIELTCTIANSTWTVTSSQGNITVV